MSRRGRFFRNKCRVLACPHEENIMRTRTTPAILLLIAAWNRTKASLSATERLASLMDHRFRAAG